MDATIKQLWLTALRSGEYEQGVGVLHHRRDNTFCCLGVLCDVVVKNGLALVDVNNGWDRVRYDGSSASLPLSVQELAGVSAFGDLPEPIETPQFADEYEDSYLLLEGLSQLNDEVGLNFEQIADVVENMF